MQRDNRLKDWKKSYHFNTNEKKTGVPLLTSEKVDKRLSPGNEEQ